MPPGEPEEPFEIRQGETFRLQFIWRNLYQDDGSRGTGIDLTGMSAVFEIDNVISVDCDITKTADPYNSGEFIWPITATIDASVTAMFDFEAQDCWLRVIQPSTPEDIVTDIIESSAVLKRVPR